MLLQQTRTPMPQEISVSYQAIKSKVYRLIDSLVVGEKSESEVQESIRRWWALIHPADRPIAQKYLLMVLGRSASALDSMGDALLSVSTLRGCAVANGRFPASQQTDAPAGANGQGKLRPNCCLVRTPFRKTEKLHFSRCVQHLSSLIFILIPTHRRNSRHRSLK